MNNEPDYYNLYFEPKAKGTLTEQWKRGEFVICNAGKCQYYYVQNEKQQEVIKTEYCLFDDNTPNWQILAPVPSYEEYERILVENDNLKQTRDALDCAVTQLREDITDYKETIDEQERELSDSAFREDNLEKENAHLTEQLIQAKQAMSQALSYLACMDRISDTEPNEQLAFDVLRKCLEDLEKCLKTAMTAR